MISRSDEVEEFCEMKYGWNKKKEREEHSGRIIMLKWINAWLDEWITNPSESSGGTDVENKEEEKKGGGEQMRDNKIRRREVRK